jgi:hypothetical protein
MKYKRIIWQRAGRNREQANLLGFGLAHGWFTVPELEETRRQTIVTFGVWWFVLRIVIWRAL